MDSLDLLKSLTKGVNKKISQEQESSMEYIVSTSLRNKNKKSAPPIIKEVSKSIDPPFDGEFIEETEDIVYGDSIIEDTVSYDTVIEDVNDGDTILENSLIEDTIIEDIVEDTIIGDEIIFEDKIVAENNETYIEKDSGHISEELPVVKKEVPKIQRNGNPFKRGPRKKKEVVSTSVEEPSVSEIVPKSEPILKEEIVEPSVEVVDFLNKKSSVVPIIEDLESVDESEELDFSEGLTSIGEIDFSSIFGDIEEDSVIEDTKVVNVQEPIIESEPIVEEEPIIELEPIEEEPIEEEPIIEMEEPKIELSDLNNGNEPTEVVEEKEDVDNPPITESVVDTNEVSSEDDKFKNCVYYKGMSVVEFLRANKDYREALFVEHFFKKEELQALLIEGEILIKKGKYRL